MFGMPSQKPRSPGLFRLRNLLVGALAIGVICGIWLGDFLPGLGLGGGGFGVGVGPNGILGISSGTNADAEFNVGAEHPDKSNGKSLRVVVKDWNYFVRSTGGDQPIGLEDLVDRVKELPGDADGIQLRVYRTESARATAEQRLQDALKAANVAESAVYVAPDIVE